MAPSAVKRRALSPPAGRRRPRSEEHTSELQSLAYLVCRLLLEKKKKQTKKMLSVAVSAAESHPPWLHLSVCMGFFVRMVVTYLSVIRTPRLSHNMWKSASMILL